MRFSSLLTWLRPASALSRLTGGPARRARRKPAPARLGVETLEERLAPSYYDSLWWMYDVTCIRGGTCGIITDDFDTGPGESSASPSGRQVV